MSWGRGDKRVNKCCETVTFSITSVCDRLFIVHSIVSLMLYYNTVLKEMHGRMDGWMDGWMSSLIKLPTNLKQSFEGSKNEQIRTL